MSEWAWIECAGGGFGRNRMAGVDSCPDHEHSIVEGTLAEELVELKALILNTQLST